MKKFKIFAMMAVVLTIFGACQKDELVMDEPDAIASSQEKSDVYVENGYLVFKDMQTLDSIASIMNKKSMNDQVDWENALGFKSARSYRSKLNEQILAIKDYNLFDKKINEVATEGYFNKETLCMDFPFENDSWSSVLNKDGVVKIENVIYCYKKGKEFAVLGGDYTLFRKVFNSNSIYDSEYIKPLNLSLKSTSLSDFGSYFGQRKWDGKYVIDVELIYTYKTQYMNFYIPSVQDFRWINVPVGVKYQLYCHQRVKRWYGWFDANTHMYHKCYALHVGGNYAPEKNFTYFGVNYSNSIPPIEASSNDLSNHYFDVYVANYPFDWNGDSYLGDLDAPQTPPIIYNIDFDIWTGKVGSESNHIDMIIN